MHATYVFGCSESLIVQAKPRPPKFNCPGNTQTPKAHPFVGDKWQHVSLCQYAQIS